jgi:hypothetical protein
MIAKRTCLLLAAATFSVAARADAQLAPEPVGRLFFTPERRAALERQRQLNLREMQSLRGETIAFDGVVRRSSGRSTTWINGIPQHDHATPTGVLVVPAGGETGRAAVSSGEDRPMSMKVGESLNRSTGEKQDGLAGGKVIVRRHPGASLPGQGVQGAGSTVQRP